MNDLILVVTTVFSGAWELFKTKVPGFGFTFADVLLACAFASIALMLIKSAFGSSGSASNGRSTRNPKISEERKNDTK